MAYRALYRQWRPHDFSHMVGQRAIIETLRNQVMTGRIAHAYLFCGSRGTGKTSTAKILAKAVNCEHPVNGDPCGACDNCRRMENEESLDVIEIDAASNNGVDEMRELRDTVKYPPQYGKYKTYIIDEVHMLSTSAFNALLKTLEEPPEYIVFILATTEPQKLPETILSRCQRFDFGRISITDIQGRLQEAAEASGAHVSSGALMQIARAAEGGMRDALSLLDMCLGYSTEIDEKLVRSILGTTDRAFLFSFGQALIEERAGDVFRMIDEIMRNGRDPAVFAKDVCGHIRALLLGKCCSDEIAEIMDLTTEDAAEYIRQGENAPLSRLMSIMDLFMALETEMRFASRPRIALENTALKACFRSEETDMLAVTERMDSLEKKIQQLNDKIVSGHFLPSKDTEERSSRTQQVPKASSKTEAHQPLSDPTAENVWKEMLSRFKKTETGIWSVLTMGRLKGVQGDTYEWSAENPDEETAYVASLNREEKKKKIEACLTELAGKPCGFTAVSTKKEEKKDPGEQAYLQPFYETFGAEPVKIVDSLDDGNL